MLTEIDFDICGDGSVAEEVRRRGFDRFSFLAEHVRRLPYCRPTDVNDVMAVLKEQRGTCSAKHWLLATVAHECGQPDVELIVGLYEMSERNTPGVWAALQHTGFDWVPEAHCYLRMGGLRYDFTGLSGSRASPFDSLLSEHLVSPEHLHMQKARLHQEAVRVWAKSNAVPFERAWALREACIQALVCSSKVPCSLSAGIVEPKA